MSDCNLKLIGLSVTEELRKKADELLERWAREYALDKTGDFAAVNILDGNFALSVAGKPNPLKQKVNAKETRPQPHARIPVYRSTAMDEIMFAIKKVNPDYFYALKEYYLRGTVKAVARELHWSETKAKQAKAAGFDMVVLMLEDRGY